MAPVVKAKDQLKIKIKTTHSKNLYLVGESYIM